MRILLTANASYAPPRGGATRSNLIWMDALARAGHQCRIVCGASGPGAALGHHASIGIQSIAEPAQRVRTLRAQIGEFQPDWVLVSSEDLGHALLREARHSAQGRIIYLAHTPQFFPFGPASWNPDPHAAESVGAATGIVAIGRHMAAYIQQELGRAAEVIHPPIYGSGPFPLYRNFARGFLTMINPCAVKGISIFLDLARRAPAREFAVVPGWGTTAEDLHAISRLPNIRVLPNARSIETVLEQTSVLLMPSLWYEGFGLIVMEAMLRGIPVISSDSGGLKEAKHSTGYVVPVRPIEHYQPVFDEHAMPKPVLPEHDAAPWLAAIEELTSVEEAYGRESAASREAALRFVEGLDAGALGCYLETLKPRAAERRERATIESLSPAQRALLLERLHKRRMVR